MTSATIREVGGTPILQTVAVTHDSLRRLVVLLPSAPSISELGGICCNKFYCYSAQ
jgi:hypothetical protein